MAVSTPQGSTVTFSSQGITLLLTSINVAGEEINVVDVTDLATTSTRKKIFGKLKDSGTVELEYNIDPDSNVRPVSGTTETMTITLPTGLTTAASLAGTGAVTSIDAVDGSGGDENPLSGSLTFTWDGFTGPTWTNAS